jgi:hypothetical protein
MRKIITIGLLGLLAPLAHADQLDNAEAELNHVYWRVFNQLDRSDQYRLKASELD